MSFKVLNNEELSLLDDNQRMQYEKEQAMYQQRVAFVEHLERLEDVQLEPYIPQLTPISVIDKIDVKSFKKAEYVMVTCNPIEKLNLQIKPFHKIEQIAPVLPLIPQMEDVCVNNIQKLERIKPVVPTITQPRAVATEFKHLEAKRSKLPIIIGPSINLALHFDDLKDNLHHPQSKVPTISVFAAEVRPFKKPKKRNTELPNVIKPIINVDYSKGIKPVKPFLPEFPTASHIAKADFHKPEQRPVNLQVVAKPTINVKSINKVERTTPNLPQISDISVPTKKIRRPKHAMSNLPTIAKLKIDSISFEAPKKTQLGMMEPLIPKGPEISFDMHKMNIPSLPEITVKDAPDAYAVLKKLISV